MDKIILEQKIERENRLERFRLNNIAFELYNHACEIADNYLVRRNRKQYDLLRKKAYKVYMRSLKC